MATITLELPDGLAAKIDELRDRLPELLSEVLMLSAPHNGTKAVPSLRYRAFEEMLDFLATGPTTEQIIAHKVSDHTQDRLRELLDKNREEGLTEAENAELDAFEFVSHEPDQSTSALHRESLITPPHNPQASYPGAISQTQVHASCPCSLATHTELHTQARARATPSLRRRSVFL
jgi:hypothetical protein